MSNQNQFNSTVQSLFDGVNSFVKSNTVVGDPVRVGQTVIIPLIDVTFGVGVSSGNEDKRSKANGGIGGKMYPSAIVVIKNDNVRIINVKNKDAVSRILDMVPDLFDRVSGKKHEKDAEDDKLKKDLEDVIKKTVEKNTKEF